MEFIKKIIYFILSIQEKLLRIRLSKTLGAKYLSNRKRKLTKGCLLELSSLADIEKNNFETKLTKILVDANFSPENLLKFITEQGTKVIYNNDASKILHPIGENEGFIYPAKGHKALYLSILLTGNIKFNTKEMFVLAKGNINQYYFIYQFYNWFAYKNNIAGLDSKSQGLLKKYLFTDSELNTLHLDDIYKLKDAIQQDKAAIEFVIKLCQKYEGSKQALEKLKNGGTRI